MALSTIQLFGTGAPNKVPFVSAQKRTNMFLAQSKDPEKGPFWLAPRPGLTSRVSSGSYGSAVCRGAISVNNVTYSVHGNTLYSTTAAYSVTSRGTLNTSSGPVSMAWNGTQIGIVDGTDGWTYTPASTTLTEITDAQFPATPATICYLAGRFIVNKANSGQFYWSALLDGQAWDALDFATAESETDNLVAVFSDHGSLVLMGDMTVEFWAPNPNAASSADAYVRIGGAGIEWGCSSAQAVAPFDTGLIFLARNKLGEYRVIKLNGYTAVPVDDPEVAYQINEQSSISSATGFSYVMDGQSFYQLNVGSISLVYDTIGWSFATTSGARHLANIRVALSQIPLVFSYTGGTLYQIDKDSLSDAGTTIAREIVSRRIFSDGNPITIWRLVLHMETGVALDNNVELVSLYVSKDGGKSFSSAITAATGLLGDYATRVIWRRLGRAREWVFKFAISPVYMQVNITGAAAEVEL